MFPAIKMTYYENDLCYRFLKDVGVKRVCKNSLTYHIVP